MKNLTILLLDFLFPRWCFSCGKKGGFLCAECLLVREAPDLPEKNHIYAFFTYKDPVVKKALWHLKYRGQKDIADILARGIYERCLPVLSELETFLHFKNPVLVPIPPSGGRGQRYNHAEEIALSLSRYAGGTLPEVSTDILYKNKETSRQMSIKKRGERLKNVRGCFSVENTEKVCGENIVLIDDIMTTGATITEARKALLGAGAKNVVAFVVAH